MKKQEYTTPQIYVKVTNITPMMDATSIVGEPTGQGNHSISGSKAAFTDDDEILED